MSNKVQSNKITAQTTAQFTSCQSSVGLEGGFPGVGCTPLLALICVGLGEGVVRLRRIRMQLCAHVLDSPT